MKRVPFILTALLCVAALQAAGARENAVSGPPEKVRTDIPGIETAIFAGGCFWGVEGVFENIEGVEFAESGYAGGTKETADYRRVSQGTTGHAESVRVIYDPDTVSYETLLDVFFTVAHDPTQLNYQGPDVGPQYRSAIFYNSPEQRSDAESYIQSLEKKGTYSAPIVTQINRLDEFYPAEEYHQDFMRRNPNHPYIRYWDAPKIEHLKEAFPNLVKK